MPHVSRRPWLLVGPASYLVVIASVGCARNEVHGVSVTSAEVGSAISDTTVKQSVAAALVRDPRLAQTPLSVAVARGVVSLTGVTESLADARRAVSVAETVRGVRSVLNRITVRAPPRTDAQIQTELHTAIERELPSALSDLSIGVAEGVVHLNGTVDSWAARDLVSELAAETRGVRAIEDRLVVTGDGARADAELASEARARIARDAWLDGAILDISAHDGIVRMTGLVGTAQQRTRAVSDASVPGARFVDASSIDVDPVRYDAARLATPPAVVADEVVAQTVREALRVDPRVGALVPRVHVVGGVVTLGGAVASGAARVRAEQIARDTLGVRTVRDVTHVAFAPPRSDADLLRDAGEALRASAQVPHPESIHIDVSAGTLVARGTVGSYVERAQVRRALVRIPGVVEVVDDVSIASPPAQGHVPTIAGRTRARIADDPELAGDRIDVEASTDGTVTLRGGVRTWGELRAATEDALVAGATHVVNLLTVAR